MGQAISKSNQAIGKMNYFIELDESSTLTWQFVLVAAATVMACEISSWTSLH